MAKLFDAYGREVNLEALREPQAAPTYIGLRNIYSAMHPSQGLTPERLTTILRQAELGDPWLYLELAQDMEEKDPHLLAVLSARKQTVAQLEILIKPASDSPEDAKAAAFVREVLLHDGGLNLQSAIVDILDALGKGFSATEITWDATGDGLGIRWIPRRLEWRDPRWFMFDWVSGEEVLVRTWRTDGQTMPGSAVTPHLASASEGPRMGIQPATAPLAPYKFIQHFAKAKAGLPIRGGLARALSWIYLFKNYVLKDAVTFSERFGMPARVGKYPTGATAEDKDALLRATAAMGSDAAAIIPDNMMIELVTAKGSGGQKGVEIYERLLRYFDSAMSKAVLGQDFTTELPKQGGSRAAAQVGKDVRDDILRWDAARLAQTLTRDLVRPVVDLNLGPRDRYPSISLKILGSVEAHSFMQAVASAADHGVDVGQDAVRDVLGIPAPLPGEKLLTPRQVVRVSETDMPEDPTSSAPPIPMARAYFEQELQEPPEPATDLRRVARVLILDEGQVWVYDPADEPLVMFPGGGVDDDSMQAAAVREAREETGLHVRLDRWLADFVDQYSWRRYYVATRIGGEPTRTDADGGKAVRVYRLPPEQAAVRLTSPFDRAALAMTTPAKLKAPAAVYAQVRAAYDLALELNAHASRRSRRPAAPLEGYAQAMAQDWRPVLGPMVDPLRRAIAGAGDLRGVKQRLPGAAKEMHLDPLVDRVARATFAARAAARAKADLP